MGRHYVSQDAFTVNDGSTRGLRRTFERLGLLGVWLIVFAGFSLLNRVCPGFRQLGCRGKAACRTAWKGMTELWEKNCERTRALALAPDSLQWAPVILSLWPMTCLLAPSI